VVVHWKQNDGKDSVEVISKVGELA